MERRFHSNRKILFILITHLELMAKRNGKGENQSMSIYKSS